MPESIKLYDFSPKFYLNHFFGMHPTVLVFSDSVPNIYSGVLTVIVMPFYYLNKTIEKKEKLLYTAFVIILFLCFNINILTYIVHGFHFPAMLPHRYSFIYSFVLLIMAFKALQGIDVIKVMHLLLIYCVTSAAIIILYFLYTQTDFLKPGRLSPITLAVNLILVAVYFFYMFAVQNKKWANYKKIMPYALLVVVILELVGNSYIHFSYLGHGKRTAFALEYYDAMSEISDLLKEEPAFYRAEFKHEGSMGESKIYDYKGINMFGINSYPLAKLMDSLGVVGTEVKLVFTNPTPLVNSVFNLKYLFNRDGPMQETFTLFNFKKQIGNIALYENPYVLPVGFMVNEDIMYWKADGFNTPYEFQNDFVEKATGLEEKLFTPIELIEYSTEHIKLTANKTTPNTFDYEIDEDITPEMRPYVKFRFIAPESRYTVIHARTGGATKGDVRIESEGGVNHVLSQTYHTSGTGFDAGFVNKGSVIELELTMNRRSQDEEQELIRFGSVTVNAAQMDIVNYESVIARLGEQPLNVTYYDETSIVGNIDVKEEGMMFTSIPYHDGWTIEVDGKKVTPRRIGQALIGVKLYPGIHTVEISYKPPKFFLGSALSLLLVCVLIVIARKEYKRDTKILEATQDGNT